VDGSTFYIGAPGVAAVTLGSSNISMAFSGMTAVAIQGGAGNDTITADGGVNIIDVGTGSLDVNGGPGTDVYSVFAGSGALTIEDFSSAKGDTLSLDSSLQGKLQSSSDGNGGTLLTFGGAAGPIDLQHVASAPTISYITV
jgi:Ca2+-binding RTX toxin-like protein